MQLYDFFTRLISTMGISPREAFDVIVIMVLGVYGGFAFMLAMCVDLGRILWRLVCRLFRFIIRRIQQREKVEP